PTLGAGASPTRRARAQSLRCASTFTILFLQENSIARLEPGILAPLASLRHLYLHNSLHALESGAFRTVAPAGTGAHWQPAARLERRRFRRPGPTARALPKNPWRCDCALHWLGAWIKEGGQRLLSPRDKKILCAEPPRLALQSLLEPLAVTANLGEDLRVACQASGYPQPQVTWTKVARPGEGAPRAEAQPEVGWRGPGGLGASDTGSGMLFLTNITLAHAGKYECEASNAGGAARVPFQLLVNVSRQQQLAPAPSRAGGPVSHEPLHEAGSMAFRALGLDTQTAIAAAIALLALRRKKASGPPGEGALFVNDYSDGPCTFAQPEELRDERGHEMFVIDHCKPLFAEGPEEAAEAPGVAQGLPLQRPLRLRDPLLRGGARADDPHHPADWPARLIQHMAQRGQ
ncbi:hypothetical protein FD754_016566, partial [Muntiacus muntjak]